MTYSYVFAFTSEPGVPSSQRPRLPGFRASKPRPGGGTVVRCDVKERSEEVGGFVGSVQWKGRTCLRENVAGKEDLTLLSSRHDEMAFL